jgi:hypothetical protein
MAYLLDANVFIEAKRRYYGFDLCPGFCDWLIEAGENEIVFSVDRVRDELIGAGDDLEEWVRGRDRSFFLPPDQDTLASVAAAVEWTRGQQFRQGAITTFADSADAYLVAHAHAHQHIVVTLEQPSDGVKQVKIPNVCVALDVPFVNTFEMLRRERARFILGGSR